MTTNNKQHAVALIQAPPGRKPGMTQAWDIDGHPVPPTVTQVSTNVVVQVCAEEVNGYSAVQFGFSETPARKVARPVASHFARVGIEPRRHLAEVHTSTASDYELGQEFQATVFEAGQAVDISGNTKGKSFAGVMKRHGFTGVPASHGVYRNHHKPGSIGARATPEHVFKGLRMTGRMRNIRRTVQSLKIQAMGTGKGLLLISGAIPGPKSGVVLVRSSVKGA